MKSEDQDKYIYEFTKNIYPNMLGGSIINYVEKLKVENKELKEQLRIGSVSQQRELLINFGKYLESRYGNISKRGVKRYINEFIKLSNCC